MKITIFLTVIFVIFFGGKLTTGMFVETIPKLEALQTPLLWLTIVSGVLLGICIVIKIIKEIKEIFNNGKKE